MHLIKYRVNANFSLFWTWCQPWMGAGAAEWPGTRAGHVCTQLLVPGCSSSSPAHLCWSADSMWGDGLHSFSANCLVHHYKCFHAQILGSHRDAVGISCCMQASGEAPPAHLHVCWITSWVENLVFQWCPRHFRLQDMQTTLNFRYSVEPCLANAGKVIA